MSRFFMDEWPNHVTIERVEPYLEPLRNIRNAVNVTEVNKHFAVFDESACRMKDSREHVSEFRRRLTKLVLHE